MSKIDWSKAPEWADGHGLVAHHGITEVWINMDQYAVVGAEDRAYPYGGGTGEARHNFTRGQVQYITPRPARWDGEGPPPAGTVCELRNVAACTDWAEATIMFASRNVVVWDWVGEPPINGLCTAYAHAVKMRPVRTPEQIAAEERDKAKMLIGQILIDNRGNSNEYHVAGLIYDAGYRKQVAP